MNCSYYNIELLVKGKEVFEVDNIKVSCINNLKNNTMVKIQKKLNVSNSLSTKNERLVKSSLSKRTPEKSIILGNSNKFTPKERNFSNSKDNINKKQFSNEKIFLNQNIEDMQRNSNKKVNTSEINYS